VRARARLLGPAAVCGRATWPAAVRGRRWLGVAAVLVLAGVLAGVLAACSGGTDGAGTSGAAVGSEGPRAADGAAGPAPAARPGDAARGTSGEAAKDPGSTASIRIEPALIRTAELTVVVDDVPGRAGEAVAAARAAGGTVAGDDRSGSGADAHATLVLKVPPDRMDAVLDRLGRLGREQSRSSSTRDVTGDVADVDARVASMEASIARVRAILSRAEKIGDVVAVEGELSRRTTELESLQARQRALAGQVDYATITLQLRARPAPPAPAPDRAGFVGGLQDGWRAFSAAVGWLLGAVGAVLPFLLVAVPLALAARWAVRRGRATAAPSGPAPRPE
jgi:Domain of unknown function (DUF4349)